MAGVMRDQPTSAEVLKLIEHAFSKVLLGEGIGIFEAEAIDNYASEQQTKKARAKDREFWRHWSEVPQEVISQASFALCFADPEGMRYLLPAYMAFSIKNYEESASASVDSPIYALGRGEEAFGGDLSILSSEQRQAIIAYLELMILEAGEYYVDASMASYAYEKFWSHYDESA